MDSSTNGKCSVCGEPGKVHVAYAGEEASRSFCLQHLPTEFRDGIAVGPHRTPDDEVAFLRQTLSSLHQQFPNPEERAVFETEIAEVEKLIADIEAGRRRLGDVD